jgi:cell division protein FtsB
MSDREAYAMLDKLKAERDRLRAETDRLSAENQQLRDALERIAYLPPATTSLVLQSIARAALAGTPSEDTE